MPDSISDTYQGPPCYKAGTYDGKCYDLAEHFLQDAPELNDERNRDDLAKMIQTVIEDWFIEAQRR